MRNRLTDDESANFIPAIKTLSQRSHPKQPSISDSDTQGSPEPLDPPRQRDFHPSIKVPATKTYKHHPFITPPSEGHIPRTPFNTLESHHPGFHHAPVQTAFLPLTQNINSSADDEVPEDDESHDSDDELISVEESDMLKERYRKLINRTIANANHRSRKVGYCIGCMRKEEGQCCCEQEEDGEDDKDEEDKLEEGVIKVETDD